MHIALVGAVIIRAADQLDPADQRFGRGDDSRRRQGHLLQQRVYQFVGLPGLGRGQHGPVRLAGRFFRLFRRRLDRNAAGRRRIAPDLLLDVCPVGLPGGIDADPLQPPVSVFPAAFDLGVVLPHRTAAGAGIVIARRNTPDGAIATDTEIERLALDLDPFAPVMAIDVVLVVHAPGMPLRIDIDPHQVPGNPLPFPFAGRIGRPPYLSAAGCALGICQPYPAAADTDIHGAYTGLLPARAGLAAVVMKGAVLAHGHDGTVRGRVDVDEVAESRIADPFFPVQPPCLAARSDAPDMAGMADADIQRLARKRLPFGRFGPGRRKQIIPGERERCSKNANTKPTTKTHVTKPFESSPPRSALKRAGVSLTSS